MERQPHDPAQAELEKKMTLDTPRIDSESVGNPLRYRRLEELEEGLDALPRGPWDRGRVELIVARTAGGQRERPERVRLEADAGIPEDAWGRQQEPHPERAITVMEFDVAELIANGQLLALFGDNVYLTLDISTENLPAGRRVRAGGAGLAMTAERRFVGCLGHFDAGGECAGAGRRRVRICARLALPHRQGPRGAFVGSAP